MRKIASEIIRRNKRFVEPQEQSAAKVGQETSHKITKPVGVPFPAVPIQKKVSPYVPDPAPDPVTDPVPDPTADLVLDPVLVKRTPNH